jgi:hypothetical protein
MVQDSIKKIVPTLSVQKNGAFTIMMLSKFKGGLSTAYVYMKGSGRGLN